MKHLGDMSREEVQSLPMREKGKDVKSAQLQAAKTEARCIAASRRRIRRVLHSLKGVSKVSVLDLPADCRIHLNGVIKSFDALRGVLALLSTHSRRMKVCEPDGGAVLFFAKIERCCTAEEYALTARDIEFRRDDLRAAHPELFKETAR